MSDITYIESSDHLAAKEVRWRVAVGRFNGENRQQCKQFSAPGLRVSANAATKLDSPWES